MLKRVGEQENIAKKGRRLADASFPLPFSQGLEYSSPARGTWNIVHTGMLIPQSHQIFVCALGCLRGVVLTAAEMGALDRYSAIQVREENVLDGGMEELMISGVADILEKLPRRPKVILLFISCQHFFLAYDQERVFAALEKQFPDVHFLDCYMIPTLRKSGMTPDQRMRIQLYRLWESLPVEKERVNLIGSNLSLPVECELVRMLQEAGCSPWDLQRCTSFGEYLDMARAPLNLVVEPAAILAAEDLQQRLGQAYLYLPAVFDFDGIEDNYTRLAQQLKIERPTFFAEREAAIMAVRRAREKIGDTPIAVDYSFTFRILSFVRFLLTYGFRVKTIYADVFLPEEEGDFSWIREHYSEIVLLPTTQPEMRFFHGEIKHKTAHDEKETSERDARPQWAECAPSGAGEGQPVPVRSEKVLAIGQKAAYFEATDYFVNVAEGGGYYGYHGIVQIMALMEEAFSVKKDRKTLIQQKGYGCDSCLQ